MNSEMPHADENAGAPKNKPKLFHCYPICFILKGAILAAHNSIAFAFVAVCHYSSLQVIVLVFAKQR